MQHWFFGTQGGGCQILHCGRSISDIAKAGVVTDSQETRDSNEIIRFSPSTILRRQLTAQLLSVRPKMERLWLIVKISGLMEVRKA
jgi:hypothetical protein